MPNTTMIKNALDILCNSPFQTVTDGESLNSTLDEDEVRAYALQTYVMFIRDKAEAKRYIVKTVPDIWARNICLNFIHDVKKIDFINTFIEKCKKEMPDIFQIIIGQEQYYRSAAMVDHEHVSMPTSLIMRAFQQKGGKMRIISMNQDELFTVISRFDHDGTCLFKSNHYAYAVMVSLLKAMCKK